MPTHKLILTLLTLAITVVLAPGQSAFGAERAPRLQRASKLVAEDSLRRRPKRRSNKIDNSADIQIQKESESANRPLAIAGNVGILGLAPAFGAGAWYALAQKYHLGVQFLTSKWEVTAKDSGDSGVALLEYATFDYKSVGLRNRYFFGNSFNVSGGLNYAMISGKYGAKSKSSDASIVWPYKADATIVDLGIGNLWQFDNGLSIGCDWVGALVFASTSVSADYSSPEISGIGASSATAKPASGTRARSGNTGLSLADESTTSRMPKGEGELKGQVDKALRGQIQLYLLLTQIGYRF